jgi:hypothetical protein
VARTLSIPLNPKTQNESLKNPTRPRILQSQRLPANYPPPPDQKANHFPTTHATITNSNRDHTAEAVRIRRQLSTQRPDAFLPNLAMSLAAHGSVLRELKELPEAVAAFREGIACLKPLFLHLPGAFQPLMTSLVIDYIQGCEAVGVEADVGLLGDVMPQLTAEEGNAPPE